MASASCPTDIDCVLDEGEGDRNIHEGEGAIPAPSLVLLFWTLLPLSVLQSILEMLTPADLANTSSVCRMWRTTLWRVNVDAKQYEVLNHFWWKHTVTYMYQTDSYF